MDSQGVSTRWFVAVALIVAIGLSTMSWADGALATNTIAKKTTTTTVSTKKMCPSCAKKIVAKMRKIDGVADARPDVKSKTFIVLPASDRVLSPRALWDTVLAGGELPIRLAGPSGVFVKRPKF